MKKCRKNAWGGKSDRGNHIHINYDKNFSPVWLFELVVFVLAVSTAVLLLPSHFQHHQHSRRWQHHHRHRTRSTGRDQDLCQSSSVAHGVKGNRNHKDTRPILNSLGSLEQYASATHDDRLIHAFRRRNGCSLCGRRL